ncbi:MAG: glycine zipper 2TM domain-containing protein [Burkholderiaceae bacterium]
MKKTNAYAAMVLSALLAVGCASPGQQSSYPSSSQTASSYGVIESIDMASAQVGNGINAGTVVGAVAGGLLGNQVGSGRGRSAATVAGAVGGALAGNQIEKRRADQQPAYNVRVHLDDGSYRTVTQDSVADLRVGNRVRIENGRVYRY